MKRTHYLDYYFKNNLQIKRTIVSFNFQNRWKIFSIIVLLLLYWDFLLVSLQFYGARAQEFKYLCLTIVLNWIDWSS